MSSEGLVLHDSNGAVQEEAEEDEDIRDLEALLGVSEGGDQEQPNDPHDNNNNQQQQQQDEDDDDNDGPSNNDPVSKTKMEALEIEQTEESSEKENIPMILSAPSEDTLDSEFDDMESLLGNKRGSKRNRNDKKKESEQNKLKSEEANGSAGGPPRCCIPCCPREEEIILGNLRVPSPRIYTWTNGWGVVGPHWFGPPCVFCLIVFATYFFAYQCSWQKGRPYSAAICMIFACTTFYQLMNAAYRNPGIVVKGALTLPDPLPRTWKFCETCDYYQVSSRSPHFAEISILLVLFTPLTFFLCCCWIFTPLFSTF